MSRSSASAAVATLGIDLGKNTFHLVGQDQRGAIVLRIKLSRTQLSQRLANIPPCLIGMEACAGAHHIGRQLQALGHDVRLLPAQYVKPFLKGHKNDYRDAEAIAEAVQRPTMSFVAIKTPDQMDLLALHRVRSRLVGQRTGVTNQIRGLLLERGITVRQGLAPLRQALPGILGSYSDALSLRIVHLIASSPGCRISGSQVHLRHQPTAEDVAGRIGVRGHRNGSNDRLFVGAVRFHWIPLNIGLGLVQALVLRRVPTEVAGRQTRRRPWPPPCAPPHFGCAGAS